MNSEYWELRAASRNYYDAYRLATRISNRLKAAARAAEEGLSALPIELIGQLDSAKQMKDDNQRLLTKLYRATAPPAVIKFQQETLGLGEVWIARLIGEVGDFITYTEAWWESGTADEENPDDETSSQLRLDSHPTTDEFRDEEEAPRPKRVLAIGEVRTTGVRELWAYCGHGDASRRRRRGQDQSEALASGNPTAKMIVHQMAEFALRLNGVPDKNGKERGKTPYYDHYLESRMRAEQNHPDWKPGHVYNYAVRKVGKAILKDLWRVQHGYAPAYGARTPWTPREQAA